MQEEGEKKFKEVKEAFTILSDPKEETHYGSGQDLDEESLYMGDSDASNIFKASFSGPGASALKHLVHGISFFCLANERTPEPKK